MVYIYERYGWFGGKIGKIFSGGAKAAGPLTKAGKPDMRFGANKGAGLVKSWWWWNWWNDERNGWWIERYG